MKAINNCIKITEELISVLKNEIKKNRDEMIENVDRLLKKREQYILEIVPPFTNAEFEEGQKLFKLNKIMQSLLNIEKQSIQKDLNGLSKKKSSMNRYINPYQNMRIDGSYYDKRK